MVKGTVREMLAAMLVLNKMVMDGDGNSALSASVWALELNPESYAWHAKAEHPDVDFSEYVQGWGIREPFRFPLQPFRFPLMFGNPGTLSICDLLHAGMRCDGSWGGSPELKAFVDHQAYKIVVESFSPVTGPYLASTPFVPEN